jgi:hypothetical protein
MRPPVYVLIAAASWFCLDTIRADTFTVTTTNALGPGSLYEAINSANAHPGADTISFNIPGSDLQTIPVGDTGLPEITDPLTIDGYTQPGAKANTLSTADNAIILIRIDGSPTGSVDHDGLIISAGDSVVRGLALTGFPDSLGLTGEALFDGTAIRLQGKGDNSIEGNFIGLSSNVSPNSGNSTGVAVGSSNNTVGGTLPAQRNVISNNNTGISIDPDASGNVIEGNYLGVDPSGAAALGNAIGVRINGTTTRLGGLVPEAANVISGNFYGIFFGSSGNANVVEGNLIGTDAGGTENFGNSMVGVCIYGSQNRIGGLAANAGNRIWFNPTGVEVANFDTDHPAVGNSLLSNSIFADLFKIDLGMDGATRNDLEDADIGPNNLQNFPVITSTEFLQKRTVVKGGFKSTPSSKFTLQFFTEGLNSSDSALQATKSVTTDANGIAYFDFNLRALPPDVVVNATATDPVGNTSEFRTDFAVQVAKISTRAHVGTGNNVLIGGFVVHRPPGDTDHKKKVLLRALGPSLQVNGVSLPGRLADPTLELHNVKGALIASNDNWRSDQETAITATGAAPKNDKESALIANLADGNYTVQVRGANSGTGLGVVEVYDLEPLDPVNEQSGRLVNISTRGLVRPGNDALIGGLIVRGDDGENVLLRAIGPDLTAEQVPNALSNPTLELRDASGTLLAANDDWRSDQEEEITATGIAPNDDRDSAILYSLPPGNYTAIVRGNPESTGVALVEIYDLNSGH